MDRDAGSAQSRQRLKRGAFVLALMVLAWGLPLLQVLGQSGSPLPLVIDAPGDPKPLSGMNRPPPPEVTPFEAEVSNLGGNDHLPEALLPYYRPLSEGGKPSGPPLTSSLPSPGQTLALTYPLALRATEISPFGWRYAESRLAWRIHTGTDLIVLEGTPVRAALPGTVRLVQDVGGYGLTVVIDHGRGWQTLYAHLLDLAVQPSQVVAAGETIGRVGRTGSATTPHLHFELRHLEGERAMALDAGPLLEGAKTSFISRNLEQGEPLALPPEGDPKLFRSSLSSTTETPKVPAHFRG